MPIHLSSADGDEEERLTGDITFNFSKVSSPLGDTDAAGRRYESLQLPVCVSRFIAAAPFKARQATLPDRTLAEQSLTGRSYRVYKRLAVTGRECRRLPFSKKEKTRRRPA